MQGLCGRLFLLATGATRGCKSKARVLGLLPACQHPLTLASPLLHVPVAASMVQPSSQAMAGSTDSTSTAFSSHTSSVTLHRSKWQQQQQCCQVSDAMTRIEPTSSASKDTDIIIPQNNQQCPGPKPQNPKPRDPKRGRQQGAVGTHSEQHRVGQWTELMASTTFSTFLITPAAGLGSTGLPPACSSSSGQQHSGPQHSRAQHSGHQQHAEVS